MLPHTRRTRPYPPADEEAIVLNAAALVPQLADGPVTVENACAGCERRDCNPERCSDARGFERLIEELQALEERGLVRLWLHNIYSARPNTRAMVRVRLTDAGRVAYGAAS